MKATTSFQQVIKTYLDRLAESDPLFQDVYAKPDKSIDKCCDFILCEVHKSGRNGFVDEEIFGMAIHYYQEDAIKHSKPNFAKVIHTTAMQDVTTFPPAAQGKLPERRPLKKVESVPTSQMSLF